MKVKILLVFGLFLYGCGEVAITGKEKLSVKKEEVGLVKSRQLQGVEYRVQFLPGYQETKSFYYFKFNIKTATIEKDKELLQYMNYQMQQDFVLRLRGDSILSVFYQPVPKAFGNNYEYLVAFEHGTANDQPFEEMEFIFDDHVISNKPIVFPYTSKDFAKNDNKKAE
jgi:hypothetical protein